MKYIKDGHEGISYYPFLIRKKHIFYNTKEQNRPVEFGAKHPFIFKCFY